MFKFGFIFFPDYTYLWIFAYYINIFMYNCKAENELSYQQMFLQTNEY